MDCCQIVNKCREIEQNISYSIFMDVVKHGFNLGTPQNLGSFGGRFKAIFH